MGIWNSEFAKRNRCFPKALMLHYLDDLDSKMEAMRASIAAAPMQEMTARRRHWSARSESRLLF